MRPCIFKLDHRRKNGIPQTFCVVWCSRCGNKAEVLLLGAMNPEACAKDFAAKGWYSDPWTARRNICPDCRKAKTKNDTDSALRPIAGRVLMGAVVQPRPEPEPRPQPAWVPQHPRTRAPRRSHVRHIYHNPEKRPPSVQATLAMFAMFKRFKRDQAMNEITLKFECSDVEMVGLIERLRAAATSSGKDITVTHMSFTEVRKPEPAVVQVPLIEKIPVPVASPTPAPAPAPAPVVASEPAPVVGRKNSKKIPHARSATLVYIKNGVGAPKIDVSASLKVLGKSEREILAGTWPKGSDELRIASAIKRVTFLKNGHAAD